VAGDIAMTDLVGSVLLIEDDPVDAELILRGLARISGSSLDVRWVTSLQLAREAVAELPPQIVLTDLTLPDARDLEAIPVLMSLCDESSLIVQTGVDDEEMPIRALELGAQDFLRKGFITPDVLDRAIRYALARSRTQAELLGAQREREKSITELDGFAHVVAHDLRAPVRTARLFADRLLNEINSDDPVVIDFGDRLESSLEKVDRMILSMLDFASLRGLVPTAVPVDLAECVEQCKQLIRADLAGAEGTIKIDVEDGLVVNADEEQLTRVLLNVLVNAVKYRRDDAPLEIGIRARSTGDMITIDVTDSGTGVKEEHAERAFEVLERLDPRRSTGLGFGLAISRRIVEGYGGSIRFVHDRPEGAHLEIVLPAAARLSAPAVSTAPAAAAAPQPGSSTTRQ